MPIRTSMSFSCSSGLIQRTIPDWAARWSSGWGMERMLKNSISTNRLPAWVPRNVAHNPWVITKVNDPKHPVMCVVVALTPTYTEPGDPNHKDNSPLSITTGLLHGK